MGENKNEKEKKEDVVIVENVEEEKENNTESEENTIKISNDTVATYAGIAISEIAGVYGMGGTFAGITEAISGKKSYTKGVKVEILDSKSAKIDVSIVVEYGTRIPDIAFEIQTKVKKSVETMTGLKVSAVNVNIQGVHAISEKEEESEETVEEENLND